MRKRMSRPARFAAVDNGAIDSLPSILSIGLLTRLIRARDGDDVTVELLAQQYSEGRKSLEKAMRSLVDAGLVVKLRVQSRSSDGERRGGSWWTTFSVDSQPFTVDDVAEMVDAVRAEGNVRAVRVDPGWLDPRGSSDAAARPTHPIRPVGPTCGNATSRRIAAGGTDRSLTDSRTTDRRSRGG